MSSPMSKLGRVVLVIGAGFVLAEAVNMEISRSSDTKLSLSVLPASSPIVARSVEALPPIPDSANDPGGNASSSIVQQNEVATTSSQPLAAVPLETVARLPMKRRADSASNNDSNGDARELVSGGASTTVATTNPSLLLSTSQAVAELLESKPGQPSTQELKEPKMNKSLKVDEPNDLRAWANPSSGNAKLATAVPWKILKMEPRPSVPAKPLKAKSDTAVAMAHPKPLASEVPLKGLKTDATAKPAMAAAPKLLMGKPAKLTDAVAKTNVEPATKPISAALAKASSVAKPLVSAVPEPAASIHLATPVSINLSNTDYKPDEKVTWVSNYKARLSHLNDQLNLGVERKWVSEPAAERLRSRYQELSTAEAARRADGYTRRECDQMERDVTQFGYWLSEAINGRDISLTERKNAL
jgi:hypothetical protein